MKTVLISGTTSGIGEAFAKKFAKEGYNIVLVARNENKLLLQQEELRSVDFKIQYIVCNLEEENAAKVVYDRLRELNCSIDILVNNAGFNECGMFINTDMQKEKEMIHLHITFLTQLTKLLLPQMIANKYGRIINVGSTGSYIPSPSDAVYSATKAYILSFSNALRGELVGSGVKVTTLCPGATATQFAKKAGLENSALFKIGVLSPQKVVEIAYPKMMKGKRVIITGIYNKMLVLFSKIMPVSFINRITLKIMRS